MNQTVDRKLIERVKKLLALANDEGATQAEAELAAERARTIMAEHGITMAQAEASGEATEGRVKDGWTGYMNKQWQRTLMNALCEQSFVVADYRSAWPGEKTGSWTLWGRESAVTVVRLMHNYLVKTVHRVVKEQSGPSDERFKQAMGERLAERIRERHEAAMAEQKRQANERRETARYAGGSNALVVVLEDYAQRESDLNNDMRYGWPAGTTAQKRREQELLDQRHAAEREEARERREARRQQLIDSGISEDVAYYMIYGYSREDAEKIVAKNNRPETDEQRERRRRREQRDNERYREQWYRRQEREARRHNHPSARAGREAADSVGLDPQVHKNSPDTKKLGGGK